MVLSQLCRNENTEGHWDEGSHPRAIFPGRDCGINRSHGPRSLTLGKYEDESPFWGQTAVTGGRHFNTGPRTPRQVQKEQCDKTDYEHYAKSQGRNGRR